MEITTDISLKGTAWNTAIEKLSEKDKNQQYVVYVNKKVLSKAKGQQKRNEKALKNQGFSCIIKGKENLEEFEVKVVEIK